MYSSYNKKFQRYSLFTTILIKTAFFIASIIVYTALMVMTLNLFRIAEMDGYYVHYPLMVVPLIGYYGGYSGVASIGVASVIAQSMFFKDSVFTASGFLYLNQMWFAFIPAYFNKKGMMNYKSGPIFMFVISNILATILFVATSAFMLFTLLPPSTSTVIPLLNYGNIIVPLLIIQIYPTLIFKIIETYVELHNFRKSMRPGSGIV